MNKHIIEYPYRIKDNKITFNKGHVVYFLLQGDYVAYVGQTTHLAARVAQHVTDGKQFDYVASVEVASNEALYIEAVNISHHNPALNIQIPSSKDISKIKDRIKNTICR